MNENKHEWFMTVFLIGFGAVYLAVWFARKLVMEALGHGSKIEPETAPAG